jgi:ABC-type nitrate/sulfonate/bicarbonate transport system substrate-binding protein
MAVTLSTLGAAGHALGQAPVKVTMARLAFPSMSSMMLDIVKARDIDKKHGVDLVTVNISEIASYYASLANGQASVLAGGPLVAQKMILEGVPIRIGLTWARMNVLSVITGDPSIKSIADLKGKTIAADMGSSEYQILSVYGRSQGLIFGKDITVVQASPPLARTQLQAKRVDAAMIWEPTTTIALHDNPAYRVIVSGDDAWSKVSKYKGWDLVLMMREDFLKSSPQALPPLIKVFQEAQQWYQNNLDEADRILVKSLKLPPGIFKEGVASGRLAYDVQPAWGPERAALREMFRIAVESGHIAKLPGDNVIYSP